MFVFDDSDSDFTVQTMRSQMDAPDLVALGQLVNDEWQQWYVLQHPGTQLPTVAQGEIRIPGVTAGFNTNVLIIGLLVLAAVVLLRK